jgi:hypothetical protein
MTVAWPKVWFAAQFSSDPGTETEIETAPEASTILSIHACFYNGFGCLSDVSILISAFCMYLKSALKMETPPHAPQAVRIINNEWPAVHESTIFADLTPCWKHNHVKRATFSERQARQDLNRWRDINSMKWCTLTKAMNLLQMTIWGKTNFIQWCAWQKAIHGDDFNRGRNFNSMKWYASTKAINLLQMTIWGKTNFVQWCAWQKAIHGDDFNRGRQSDAKTMSVSDIFPENDSCRMRSVDESISTRCLEVPSVDSLTFFQLWGIRNRVVNHGESHHRGSEFDDSSKQNWTNDSQVIQNSPLFPLGLGIQSHPIRSSQNCACNHQFAQKDQIWKLWKNHTRKDYRPLKHEIQTKKNETHIWFDR